LAGHESAGDTFRLEGIDQFGKFAEREPVDLGPVVLDGWIGLLFDGRDNDLIPLGTRRVQDKEGKASVAGDEAKFGAEGTGNSLTDL